MSTEEIILDTDLRIQRRRHYLEVERKELEESVRVKVRRINQIDKEMKELEEVEVSNG